MPVTIARLRKSDSKAHRALAAALAAEPSGLQRPDGSIPASLLFQRLAAGDAAYALERCGGDQEDRTWCAQFGATLKARGRGLIPRLAIDTAELAPLFNSGDVDWKLRSDIQHRARVIERSACLAAARPDDLRDVCTCLALLASAVAEHHGKCGRDAMLAEDEIIRVMARDCDVIAGSA